MKKLIVFLLLVFTSSLFAQYKTDGRRIWKGTVKNEALDSSAVDGGVMLEATRYIWFPVAADSGVANLHGTAGWVLDTTAPASWALTGTAATGQIQAFTFDADGGTTGDDLVYLTFVCPDDYETDSMELLLYWYHLDDNGGITDVVDWDGTVQAVASTEDLFAAGTAMTHVATTCTVSDSALYITNLDPEVETIEAGDLITIAIWVDESASSLDSGELAYLIGVLVEYEAKDE